MSPSADAIATLDDLSALASEADIIVLSLPVSAQLWVEVGWRMPCWTCSDQEPLTADSRFWMHPRVTVTAHTFAITDGQARRNDVLFLENLRRFLADEPLLNEAGPREVQSSPRRKT
jgi:phosphoglycerate dehydrogenase-like enzyme